MNILVKGLNWIGDAVMSTPFFESLRLGFPDSEITVLSKPIPSEILKNNTVINKILSIEHDNNKIETIKLIRKEKYDLGILLPRSLSSAMLLYFGGVKKIVGYNTQCRGLFLDTKIDYTNQIKSKHQVYLHLNIAYHLNCPKIEQPKLKLFSDAYFDKKIDSVIDENKKYIIVFPGTAAGSHKQWSVEKFAEVTNYFIDKGYNIFLSGSPAEDVLAQRFLDKIKRKEKVVNLIDYFMNRINDKFFKSFGQNPIQEIISLMKKVDLVLCNDSGPMHMAAALNVNTVAVFSSSSPELTGPISNKVKVIRPDIDCAPCRKRKCKYGHYNCTKVITVQQVIDAINKKIKN